MANDKREEEELALRQRVDAELERVEAHPRMSADELSVEQAEWVALTVAQRGMAPDPFEEAPEARQAALASLTGRAYAFGLARLPANYRDLSGQSKIDFWLELPDPKVTVQALSAEEFSFILQDIGFSDAAPLMALGSPRQLQAVVDLDAWREGRFDLDVLTRWLEVCGQAGPEVVERFVASQPEVVWTLLFAGSLRVFETVEEAELLADPEAEVFSSPDNAFVLTVDRDDPRIAAVRQVMDTLFHGSVVRGRRLLRAVRWETVATAEQDLQEERSQRIAEHGFLSRAEARTFYAWVDPDGEKEAMVAALRAGGEPQVGELRPFLADGLLEVANPRTTLAQVGFDIGSLLGRALRQCPAEERARLQIALVRLAYRAQAARAVSLVSFDELARWSRHAFTTCDMGLSWLSDGDEAAAALLLQIWPLARIFSVGHALVVRLHHRARALRRVLGGSEGIDLLEPEDAALLTGLLRPLPELARPRVLETSALDDALSEEERLSSRPFESLDELQEARGRLLGVAAAARLLDGLFEGSLAEMRAKLGATMPQHLLAELRLTSMLGTAIAWTALKGAPSLEALTEAEARRFLVSAMQPGLHGREIKTALRQSLLRALLSAPDLSDDELQALETLLNRTLDRLQDELGGLDPHGPLDLRFAGVSLIFA